MFCCTVLLRHVLLSGGLLLWPAAHIVDAVTFFLGVVAHTVIVDTLFLSISGFYRRPRCVELAVGSLSGRVGRRRGFGLNNFALASWWVPVKGPARRIINRQPRLC